MDVDPPDGFTEGYSPMLTYLMGSQRGIRGCEPLSLISTLGLLSVY